MVPYGQIVTLMGVTPDDAEMTACNMNLSIHNEMMLTPMWLGLTERLQAQAAIVKQAVAVVAKGKGKLRIRHAEPCARCRGLAKP